MVWCRPGDKPLCEPMMVSLLTHICITQPQWVNSLILGDVAIILIIYFSNSFYLRAVLAFGYCRCLRQSVLPCVCINHLLVGTITRDSLKLGSPNLDQRCKSPWLRSLFFSGQLTLTFKIKFNFTPFWACPHHNKLPIETRITKFGLEVHNSLVKILIVLGGNWPWPSSPNLT